MVWYTAPIKELIKYFRLFTKSLIACLMTLDLHFVFLLFYWLHNIILLLKKLLHYILLFLFLN